LGIYRFLATLASSSAAHLLDASLRVAS